MKVCETTARALVAGEELAAEQVAHLAICAACRGLAERATALQGLGRTLVPERVEAAELVRRVRARLRPASLLVRLAWAGGALAAGVLVAGLVLVQLGRPAADDAGARLLALVDEVEEMAAATTTDLGELSDLDWPLVRAGWVAAGAVEASDGLERLLPGRWQALHSVLDDRDL